MCLQIEIAFSPHPETARVAEAAFPQGNPYLKMRALLGTLFADAEFAQLFPPQGQPAEAPFLQEVPAVQTLRQVWSEQYTPPPGPPRFKTVQERAPAAEWIASPQDPQARSSTKREVCGVGYKEHLTETCDPDTPPLITDVLTTSATSPDSNQRPTIHQALKQRDLLPHAPLGEAGYADAQTLAIRQHQDGVQVTAPAPPEESWQAAENVGFARTDFVMDGEAQGVRCPAGKQRVSWLPCREKARRCAWHVRFARKDCTPCPHHSHCTRSQEGSRELWLQSKEE
jgi:transposase